MEFFFWKPEKNEWLKKNRNICFEDIVLRINTDHILAVVENPNQKTARFSVSVGSLRVIDYT